MHFAARAIEYVVLHANRLTFAKVIEHFRAVAVAWGAGTKGYEEVVHSINLLKEDMVNFTLTPARVWTHAKNLFHSGKHLTQELIAFMDSLEGNICLDYVITLDQEENVQELLFGKLVKLSTLT